MDKNKQVIKAMFQNVASKDPVRPVLNGIHFEKERCVATDTHILVVYKYGSPELEGKVLSITGEEVKGNYPNVDRVLPSQQSQSHYPYRIDLNQLQKACAWAARDKDAHENDMVVIDGKALSIRYLNILISLFNVAGEIRNAELMKTDDSRPAVINSPLLTAIVMPMAYELSRVDAPRTPGDPITYSYENLINQFVFNGWKKEPVADPMAWLG